MANNASRTPLAPILVIQTRRLGDLILSFPLFLRLRNYFPQNSLWVCAEEQFSSGLASLLPDIRFLPPAHLPWLARESYAAVINLSSSAQAAACAGLARSSAKIGMVAEHDGLRARGFWQLYRAALTMNNRHNLFHWADLNCLDICHNFPLGILGRNDYTPPGKGAVGLFVGASEAAKRPEPRFWSRLARRLAQDGLKPILFGGKAEMAAANEIAAGSGPGLLNLCGKLSIAQLGAAMQTLDLFVTPDTGPMHLASWLGVPVLNLSMGNVNSAETGPGATGSWIARASMSCVGCWRCSRPKVFCRDAFHPAGVAAICKAILEGETASLDMPPGLELLRVTRDALGLITQEAVFPEKSTARGLLDQFWKQAFLAFRLPAFGENLDHAARALLSAQPKTAASLAATLGRMLARVGKTLASGQTLPENYWQTVPYHSQLFAGYSQMALRNDDYSRKSAEITISRLETLREKLAR